MDKGVERRMKRRKRIGRIRDGMSGHWNREVDTTDTARRKDLFESISSSLSFRSSTIQTILVGEKSLADGIGKRDTRVVNKGDVFDAPSNKTARDVAAQSPGADEKTTSLKDVFERKIGDCPPSNELEIEIDLRFGDFETVHHRPKVEGLWFYLSKDFHASFHFLYRLWSFWSFFSLDLDAALDGNERHLDVVDDPSVCQGLDRVDEGASEADHSDRSQMRKMKTQQ